MIRHRPFSREYALEMITLFQKGYGKETRYLISFHLWRMPTMLMVNLIKTTEPNLNSLYGTNKAYLCNHEKIAPKTCATTPLSRMPHDVKLRAQVPENEPLLIRDQACALTNLPRWRQSVEALIIVAKTSARARIEKKATTRWPRQDEKGLEVRKSKYLVRKHLTAGLWRRHDHDRTACAISA